MLISTASPSARRVTADINNKQVIFNQPSNSHGHFYIETEFGKNLLLYAEKERFISSSENINLNKHITFDSINRNIYLSEIYDGSLFRLNGIFFEFAKYELLETSMNDLNRVVQLLNSHPALKLEIHGHTDFIGSDDSNMELSKQRALSVKDFLIKNNIDPERLIIKYFGESEPIASNETDEGRQLNRRVEFVIKK